MFSRIGADRFLVGGILLLALVLRLYSAQYEYLHLWDERFHALVAKNMARPLDMPLLYMNPLLPYHYSDWSGNHIWLAKPPLPMWIMGLSLDYFGNEIWALRAPSIALGVCSVWLTIAIARVVYDKRTAYIAGFLHAIHGLTLMVNSGQLSSDHVDTFFLFFISLGIWVFLRYAENSIIRGLLTGLCFGLAFWCKWWAAVFLPILLIAYWFLENRDWRFLAAFIVSALTWLIPLSLFFYHYVPEEFLGALSGALEPVTESVHGRGRPWWFYLDGIRKQYGELIYLPMVYYLYRYKSQRHRVILVWFVVYLALLSGATTKRMTYALIMAPALFIMTAFVYREMMSYAQQYSEPRKRQLIRVLAILLLVLPFRYGCERVGYFFPREVTDSTVEVYDRFNSEVPDASPYNHVIFNEPKPIEAMFYANVTAYRVMPSDSLISDLKTLGYKVYLREEMNLRNL